MDVGIRNNLGKSARSAGKKDIAKKITNKKEKPDLRPAFLIWILKFVMKLRSFCLCFWALLPDGKRAI